MRLPSLFSLCRDRHYRGERDDRRACGRSRERLFARRANADRRIKAHITDIAQLDRSLDGHAAAVPRELWSMIMDTKTILPLYHGAVGIAWSDRVKIDSINPFYYHLTDISWAK